MKIDELIEYAKIRDKHFKDMPIKVAEEYLNNIALAALKSHKAGYKMYTYDYSERDLVEADCELSKLLEELKR